MASKKTSKTKGNGPAPRARKATASTSDVATPKRGTADDRTNNRVPIQLLVDYKADGHYLFDFCKDLGTGGVFIQTDTPLANGSSIDLTFTIPDSKETLVTKGTVIWAQKAVTDRPDLTPGMGVQFAGFTADQRRTLEDFVARYHKSATPTPIKQRSDAKRAG